jgi:hypothetical protein
MTDQEVDFILDGVQMVVNKYHDWKIDYALTTIS